MAVASLQVGRKYRLNDPQYSPETVSQTVITILQLDPGERPESLSVVYVYEEHGGASGAGTMQLGYALEFLEPLD